jgi:aspartyl-tRNA(Asn)/glutamyl-tRNA(Gln) amidotransferase subunit C
MSLSIEDVRRIAHLARIRVTEAEAAQTQIQLNGIFGLIEEMQGVDTTGIEPMAHAQDLSQRLRPDVANEPNRREAYQAIAPQTENGLYLVPKVIE